ncbi:MAG: Xaa-Pro aminopeptidase [Micavibrio sp.]|nr:MAG: Xaa-Pro aminopeptidase [Micavibrio sp.]
MSDKNSIYKVKLAALRENMAQQGLDGLIVPHADAFQSEYPPPGARRLEWLTGFSGSAGVAVVLADKAVVMSDGRYTIQLAQQVDGDLFETGDVTKAGVSKWLPKNASKGQVIGYDPWLFTPKQIEGLEDKIKDSEIVLKGVSENPVDVIWQDRPEAPMVAATIFPEEIAGISSAKKREMITEEVKKAGGDAVILTQPDSVCWLLNVRGNDVDYVPSILSYAILHVGGNVDWFVEPEKVPDDVKQHLGQGVQVLAPSEISQSIAKLTGKVLLDFQRSPMWFKEQKIDVIDFKDPCVSPKACKTKEERAAIEQAHVSDGVAIVRFLVWLDQEARKGQLTELGVVEKLEEFRQLDKNYKGPSFDTISGFGPNGAIVHYRVSEETNSKIESSGLLLVDSGGQYHWGTTDITRTIAIGEPSEEMKVNFTRVLRGHIALATARFPAGTVGAQIDALARQPLWNSGLDFAHGTGHGVGCYLQVHEEAASISPRGKEPFEAGMLISNEPGYYKKGAYGIRIENLVLVEEAERCADTDTEMLNFKTVTLAPIDRKLIVANMLSMEERQWLNAYHERVRDVLSSKLDKDEVAWLTEQTHAL